MAKKKQGLKVVKVPLDYFPNQYSANFQPMPIMYLELLENKDKVKKELRNKDYIPPQERIMEHTVPTTEQAENQNMIEIDKDFEIKDYSAEYPDIKFSSDGKTKKREPIKILDLSDPKPISKVEELNNKQTFSSSSSSDDVIREKLNQRFENIKNEFNRTKSSISVDDDDDLDFVRKRESTPKNNDRRRVDFRDVEKDEKSIDDREDRREDKLYDDRENRRHGDDREEEREEERLYDDRNDRNDRKLYDDREEREEREERNDRRHGEEREERNDRRHGDEREDRQDRQDREDRDNRRHDEDKEDREEKRNGDTQNKIMNLLFEDDKPEVSKQNFQNNNQNFQNNQRRFENNLPPKLSEINNGIVRDVKGVRDITKGLTKQEEEEDMEKRILLDKFSILKKKYKDAKIPDFNLYTDFGTLKKTYESTVRNLQLDATVDNYKRYLMIGFGLTQYLITKFTNIDMTGFAEQQILGINQYERILIEIGEKSYFTTNTSPPELRLLLLIGFNAVIFVMSKMMFSPSNGLSSVMNNTAAASKSQEQKPKTHMKGPNLDDLKEFENLAKKAKNE
jgi:hypothetical protein